MIISNIVKKERNGQSAKPLGEKPLYPSPGALCSNGDTRKRSRVSGKPMGLSWHFIGDFVNSALD